MKELSEHTAIAVMWRPCRHLAWKQVSVCARWRCRGSAAVFRMYPQQGRRRKIRVSTEELGIIICVSWLHPFKQHVLPVGFSWTCASLLCLLTPLSGSWDILVFRCITLKLWLLETKMPTNHFCQYDGWVAVYWGIPERGWNHNYLTAFINCGLLNYSAESL